MEIEHENFEPSTCGSNIILLPGGKKKKKMRGINQVKGPPPRKLSKSQKRKLMKLQEEKEKRALEIRSMEILKKHSIQDDVYGLLKSSATIGQVETMRKKRQRAVQFSKAGLELPLDVRLSKKSRIKADVENDLSVSVEEKSDNFVDDAFELADGTRSPICETKTAIHNAPTIGTDTPVHVKDSPKNPRTNFSNFGGENGTCLQDLGHKSSNTEQILSPTGSTLLEFSVKKSIVHVSRPNEVECKRADLPIVMMEQEIMEAINENTTTIVCGETGCGKTTQVPQFLYEAGFGSKNFHGKQEIIGVTQPRRVAVLATAKRVAYELGLSLGREIGFQVRHDKVVGASCSIKFMTDGILLREIQSDFLLRRYSIILLDEAHERSLNTDILIGMLSRIIEVRQRQYIQQQEKILAGVNISQELLITPLKLVLMSATLRVEDFTFNKRLFREPPPVIEVPTRQFPVTVHFSKRTEIVDYIGQAYKKIMLVHKKLPPGGILVFVTGQREVEYLCRKLRKASRQLAQKRENLDSEDPQLTQKEESEEGPNMRDIIDAFDADGHNSQTGRFGSCDEDPGHLEKDSYSSDSGSASEFEEESDEDDSFNGEREETGMVQDFLKAPESLESLKAAFEIISGKTPVNDYDDEPICATTTKDGCSHKQDTNSFCPGALHVLPLYAMLPASAQLRVFENVREGERLVVVATNVAETSLTIPGIKYVVDTGREKVKNYNYANGMAKYEIQWISKASASQRAGRAGRTGPGHCYRLYSSAVFSNQFLDYSSAEITTVPVDGIVLQLKSMGIDKVANFPFPTPPKTEAVKDAERCLEALEALDKEGRLTIIGDAMAKFPISPRHSRMLLTIFQMIGKQRSYARANLVLGYAVAASAALSFSNPFIMQVSGSQTDRDNSNQNDSNNRISDENDKKVDDFEEKLKQKKLKAVAREARRRFCNASSDALTTAYALQLFELSKNQVEFCDRNALHFKTMDEMSKLRKQLLRLIFYQNSKGGFHDEFFCIQGNLEDVEHIWRVPSEKHPLLLYEEELLGQAICAGWADRVAKRIRTVTDSSGANRKTNAVRYQACMVKETVFLHPWSSVSFTAPEFLVYNELLCTKRPYMHGVTTVRSDWLVKYARSMCTFSAPLSDPKPYYEPVVDQALCWVSPTFGPYLWQLPPSSGIPVMNEVLRASVFACALLRGDVLPCLKSVQKFLAAPPTSILRPEASGQKRVGNLLHKLLTRSRVIDSRAMLRKAWNENPQELHSEIQQWFQKSFYDNFEALWAQMHNEALCEVSELFPRRSNKEKKSKK